MKVHKVARLFPEMTDAEFLSLVNDIRENGQLEPIVTYKGQIIDGVHRHKACLQLKIEPKYREWGRGGSVVSFVISQNLKRRHLNSSQKAMIADDARELYDQEARERQKTSTGGAKPRPVQKIAQAEQGKARDKLAVDFGTNRQYVDDARSVKEKRPDLAAQVRSGEKTISQANRELRKDKVAERLTTLLPTDKFRVIYADPPWKYGNDGIIDDDNYGHVSRHYDPMSISDLCAMDVLSIVETNAVLFLWVTSPLLAECWPVIRSWGFQYKSSFVWDKVKHNFGHYNSVRHEFLLICTRGSCTPDDKKLHDSVVSEERTSKHSEKPECFRKLIEKMYPHGKRIELFARKKTKGWEVFGNEC